jgi:hypothetical protein
MRTVHPVLGRLEVEGSPAMAAMVRVLLAVHGVSR